MAAIASRHADVIAGLLAARHGAPLDSAALSGPRSAAEAYEIQAGVMAALGPIGGWKVGRSAPEQPIIRAPIGANAIRPSPATWLRQEVRLRGLELEIGFRIDAAPPPPEASDFVEQLARSVTPLPVFEIVDSRLADPRSADPLWVLADFQMNAGLVCGMPMERPWRPHDFDRPNVRLMANDVEICGGPATLPGGSPFALLAALVRECGEHCGGLQPGQIVTTGSFTGLRFFPPGTTLTGSIAGMMPLTTTFAA